MELLVDATKDVLVAILAAGVGGGVQFLWRSLDRETRALVQRFREVLAAHDTPAHQAGRLFDETLTASDFASNKNIAKHLTTERCDRLCERLKINSEWLLRGEGTRQSSWTIDRNGLSWIDMLGMAKTSADVKMVICRSEPLEISDNPRQAGAIILLKRVGTCGDCGIETCWPCVSLQHWDIPQQRDLATRLIIACNALQIQTIGVTIPGPDCQNISSGQQLAATYQSKARGLKWYPDDYGHSARSASAKSTDWHADTVLRMEVVGQIARLASWKERLGIGGEWTADAILQRERVSC